MAVPLWVSHGVCEFSPVSAFAFKKQSSAATALSLLPVVSVPV